MTALVFHPNPYLTPSVFFTGLVLVVALGVAWGVCAWSERRGL